MGDSGFVLLVTLGATGEASLLSSPGASDLVFQGSLAPDKAIVGLGHQVSAGELTTSYN